jgi:G3E family GTPase
VESLSFTDRSSLASQYRLDWMLGSNRREERRWEWETCLPKVGSAPVSMQRRDMVISEQSGFESPGFRGVTFGSAYHVLRSVPRNVIVMRMLPPNVTLLVSLDPLLRERAVAAARARDRDLVVVRHELTSLGLDGHVHRRIDDGCGSEDVSLDVADRCCLSCLLREDTIQLLGGLSGRRVLLVLPPSVEPANVAALLADDDVATITSITAAADLDRLEARLCSAEPLADIEDLGDDERSAAEVLARHLDHAELVLHDGGDERALALLAALTGGVQHGSVDEPRWIDAGAHDHDRFVARLQPGVPGCRGEVARHGVAQRCWHRRRPLHPHRLLEVLGDGQLAGLVRVSGWVWVATRPGTVLELDGVGEHHVLAAAGAWLDALADHTGVHPARLEVAERRWDPYYGDRAQQLVLTSLDRDLDGIVRLLDGCLLTDAELTEGADGWRAWPDPMSPWLGAETDLLTSYTQDPT